MKISKVVLIVAGIVILAGVGFAGYKLYSRSQFDKYKTVNFVTALPLDLDQIESVSKFRSCAGHDYSGKNILGEAETGRSMKHYANPLHQYYGTNGQVKVLAPFDGKVINNELGKDGDNLDLVPDAAPGWIYELGHIDSVKSLTVGSSVKAGQLVGYYSVRPSGGSFDIQLWFGGDDQTVNTTSGEFDSLFAHASEELKTKMSQYGLTQENLIVSKAERDASPCKSSGQQMGVDIFTGDPAKEYVTVKH
jgi:hypothetical protein